MSKTSDDLDAVRKIVEALESFEPKEQERIIRWAREKLGLWVSSVDQDRTQSSTASTQPTGQQHPSSGPQVDIKAFINLKQPQSDRQLAAVVAYFYKFEAPQPQRKNFITREDLQEACRLAVVERPKRPEQTLVNAQRAGLLDKGPERGTYVINSVGENLVAMALPSSAISTIPTKRNRRK